MHVIPGDVIAVPLKFKHPLMIFCTLYSFCCCCCLLIFCATFNHLWLIGFGGVSCVRFLSHTAPHVTDIADRWRHFLHVFLGCPVSRTWRLFRLGWSCFSRLYAICCQQELHTFLRLHVRPSLSSSLLCLLLICRT